LIADGDGVADFNAEVVAGVEGDGVVAGFEQDHEVAADTAVIVQGMAHEPGDAGGFAGVGEPDEFIGIPGA